MHKASLSQIDTIFRSIIGLLTNLISPKRTTETSPNIAPIEGEFIRAKQIENSFNELCGTSVSASVKIQQPDDNNFWSFVCSRQLFDKIIIYLVFNARDVIANGGSVIIRLQNEAVLDKSYATISIETTQEAISVDTTTTQGFFTRQEHTLGLGLADLDALIQKIGGYIQISSVPNSGTKATIYLPK